MEQQHCVAYEMEYLKMAMLKHEEIFKQQVYELHRVYGIQKMLMKTTRRQNYISNNTNMNYDHNPRHTEKHMRNLIRELERPNDHQKCSFNMGQRRVVFEAEEEGAIDLTLGLAISCNNNDSGRHKKPSSGATQLTSDSVMSFSSSSTGSSRHLKRACKGGIRISDMEEHQELFQRQQEKVLAEQPPWLLQALSLNMT